MRVNQFDISVLQQKQQFNQKLFLESSQEQNLKIELLSSYALKTTRQNILLILFRNSTIVLFFSNRTLIMKESIYQLSCFPSQSPVKSIITVLFFLVYLYHQISTTYHFFEVYYLMITPATQFTFEKLVPAKYSIICYAASPIIILLCINTAIYNQNKYSGIRYLLAWIGTKLSPVLRLLLEFNVAMCAFFVMLDTYCLVFYSFAAVISLMGTYFLQNYSISQDYLMCGNVTFSLAHRIVLYINIILNQSLLWYQSQKYYNTIITIRFFIIWSLWLMYILKGFNIYHRFGARLVFLLCMMVTICAGTSQFIDQAVYLAGLHNFYFDYIYLTTIIGPLTLVTYWIYGYKMNQIYITEINKDNIQQKSIFFECNVHDSEQDIQIQSLIRGLVIDHITHKCKNPLCYSHKQIHYSSRYNKQLSIDKIGANKAFYGKLLMRCWYQTQIDNQSSQQKIDLAQFLFFKSNNTLRSIRTLEQIQNKSLFPFEKLRIARLKKNIEKQNIRLNKQLFNGTLDIQFIINNQNIFDNLKTLISSLLQNNKSFWSTVYHNKVDLTQLVKTIKPNFKILETINTQWKLLSNYFDIQRKWKFYYAWFTLYVKNQKLKPVILEDFTTQVKQQDIFRDFISQNKNQTNQSHIMFSKLSVAIHTDSIQGKYTIKKASNFFTKIFGYDQSEIVQSPIQILMTDTLSKTHGNILHDWSYQGKSATYTNYNINKVYIKHKQGHLIGANKYYKQLVTSTNQLECVSLFNTFDEEQNVLITNESLNVQGMSTNLFKQLGFNKNQLNQHNISGINLTILIPKLIKISNDYGLIKQQDKLLFGIQRESIDNQKTNNGLNKIQKQIDQLQVFKSDLTHRNQIQIQCDIKIYKHYQKVLFNSVDKSQKNLPLSQRIQSIRNIIQECQNQKQFRYFSSILKIVKMNLKENIYYEIHFIKLQQNNKRNNTKVAKKSCSKRVSNLITSQFHKQFQSIQDQNKYSLQYSNNIFIKQEHNKPTNKLNHINIIKNSLRVLFITILIVCISSTIVVCLKVFNQYADLSKQIVVIQNIDLHQFYYENCLYEINYYNQNLIPVQYHTESYMNKILETIDMILLQLQSAKHSPDLMKAIFNQHINLKQIYGTTNDFQITPMQYSINLKYDQTDFLFKLFQMQEAIQDKGVQTIKISDMAFNFISSYLTPSFEILITNIQKNLFSYLFLRLEDTTKSSTFVFIVLGVLFIVGIIVAILKIRNIVQCFISMIGVFTSFNQEDIQKTYKYSHLIYKFFKCLKIKDNQQKTMIIQHEDQQSNLMSNNNLTFDGNIYESQNNNNININKKIKKIQVGSILNKIRLKTYGLILLTLAIFAGGSFYSIFVIKQQNQRIHFITSFGNHHFKHHTTITRVLSAVNKKLSDSVSYSSYFEANYIQQIEILTNLKNNNQRLIQYSKNFSFVNDYNSFYFQNPCQLVILDDPQDLQNCETVADGSLQFGIQSFIYYFADKALNYLNNSSSIDYPSIFQYQQGLRYVNMFMVQLTNRWLVQYQQTVDSSTQTVISLCVAITIGLVIGYLVLFELLTIRNLNIQYQTFRDIYNMYMPDFLVTKQKIIKAKLVADGILNK